MIGFVKDNLTCAVWNVPFYEDQGDVDVTEPIYATIVLGQDNLTYVNENIYATATTANSCEFSLREGKRRPDVNERPGDDEIRIVSSTKVRSSQAVDNAERGWLKQTREEDVLNSHEDS